ncbi:MAG TPA: hypothetical protein VGN12_25845 [Pirellulales bacterium]|jgi:hypothetical protein
MSHRNARLLFAAILGGTFASASLTLAAEPAAPRDGDMLDSIERVRSVMRGMMETEVRAAISDARQRLATDPEGVRATLAQEAARVRIAPELDPVDRTRLLGSLQSVSREAARRSSTAHTAAVHAQEVQAEHQARRQLHQNLAKREQKIERQLAHANDLAGQGDYRAAEEATRSLADGNATIVGTTTPLEADLQANQIEMQALLARRRQHLQEEFRNQDRQLAVDTDARPVMYPAAEKWQQISERRREWRENASTYRPSAGEAKINRALQEVTSVDFQEMPLSDALDFLKHKFNIEIQLDTKGMSEENIGPSTPITKNLNNIKLRSILRLILGDLNLAYVVKDDVLLITSIESADSMTTTRVYDVGDLVVPVTPLFFPGRMPF